MNKQERQKFRRSSKWKRFRLFIRRLHRGKDFITQKALTRSWNLHHLCMNPDKYNDLTDQSMFIPLNKNTHEFLHWLYALWIIDPHILDRLTKVLFEMRRYNDTKNIQSKTPKDR